MHHQYQEENPPGPPKQAGLRDLEALPHVAEPPHQEKSPALSGALK
jgi:hypothetical protein